MKSIHANIVKCCCCNQGSVDFKVYFNKNAYPYGDTAVTWCELDNGGCKVNCNSVNACLIHELRVTDNNGGGNLISRTINTSSV